MNAKTLSLVGAIASTLALLPAAAEAAAPDGKESCYGVSMKGQNDCAAGAHSCAGQSTADYSGKDFKFVPAGTCAKMKVHGHKGSLTPV